ncbi:hypothetical protein G9A89_021291 [Geosiphon pyriformis]|nr:hypothetical protein G9A89_021291 [Geosiphon pyriformis]
MQKIPTILELLVIADELILENFIDPLEEYLIEHHAKELEENFATLQKTSFMHDSFKNLQNFCTEIAANNPAIVFNSQDFTSLNENSLSSILNRDDLNIEESEIWEKIVEWGVAKLDNNVQMKNVFDWKDENFNAFKESIERLLLLIRFFNISSVDFYYKSVDAQPLRSNVNSKLLQSHNIKQLDHWIQGKDENAPFENQLGSNFNLLLRGSPDGFSPADFHRLCDDKGATKNGLIPRDSSIPALVSGSPMLFSPGVVRLLGVAEAFGVGFGFRKSCLFFSGIGDEVSIHIGA